MREIGFTSVEKSSFRNSRFNEAVTLDSQERAFETLYIDALK
jgi:hypothetical protein